MTHQRSTKRSLSSDVALLLVVASALAATTNAAAAPSSSGSATSGAGWQQRRRRGGSASINVDGGWTELAEGLLGIFRGLFEYPIATPLPKCDEGMRAHLRRSHGPRLQRLEREVLKASAAATEWRSALSHPIPEAYRTSGPNNISNTTVNAAAAAANGDENNNKRKAYTDAYAAIVANKTAEAEANLTAAERRVADFRARTLALAATEAYAVCYEEAMGEWSPSASLLLRAAARSHTPSSPSSRGADCDSDEDSDVGGDMAAPFAAAGVGDADEAVNGKAQKNKKASATSLDNKKNVKVNASSPIAFPLVRENPAFAGLPWLTRFQLFAEVHSGVLLASLSATVKDYVDHSVYPSWDAFRSFYEQHCDGAAAAWWRQAERRQFVAGRLLRGLSPSASAVATATTTSSSTSGSVGVTTDGYASDASDSTKEQQQQKEEESKNTAVSSGGIPTLATAGEGINFGPRPGSRPRQLDPRLGKVSYTGKDEEDKKWADRTAKNLKDPFLWLDLTEAAHVSPSNAHFSAFIVGAEAVLCYAVAGALYVGGWLTAAALLLMVHAAFPFIAFYVVGVRWLFGIFVRDFFWNFFVHGAAMAASGAAAPPALSLGSLIASAKNGALLAAAKEGLMGSNGGSDNGATALPLLIIIGAVVAAGAVFAVPFALLCLDFIGPNESVRRTAQSLQAMRAREALAMREGMERRSRVAAAAGLPAVKLNTTAAEAAAAAATAPTKSESAPAAKPTKVASKPESSKK